MTQEQIIVALRSGLPLHLHRPDIEPRITPRAVLRTNAIMSVAADLIEKLSADREKALRENRGLSTKVDLLEEKLKIAVESLRGRCEYCRWEESSKCASCIHDSDAWNTHDDNWEWCCVQNPKEEVRNGQV